MKSLLFAGIAGVMLATPAFAQDTSEDEAFSGVYIGGTVGFDSQPNDPRERILFDKTLDGNFDSTILNSAGQNAFGPGFCNGQARGTAPVGCRNDRDGVGYAARVGWDKQMGHGLVGVVADFGKSEIRDSVSAFSTTPANYVMNRKIGWEGSIRGRAGYVAGQSTLFYGTFGVGYARVKNEFTTTNTVNTFSDNGDRNNWGILAGGGVEQKIGRHFSIGLEYMYHDYKDSGYRVRVSGPPGTPFTDAATGGSVLGTDLRRSPSNFRWHSMRATAAYRF